MSGKRERNRREQRQRILEAAFLGFAERGFDAVTMAEIAAGARVSRATVFTYFPSKRALVDAMTGAVVGYWQGMLERALEETDTPVPTLIRALLDHMAVNIERFDVFNHGMFREIVKLQAGLEEGTVAQESRAASEQRLTRLIERGQERGELSLEHRARDLAVALGSLYNGAIVRWLFEDRSESLRARMRRTADLYLGPVEEPSASHTDAPLPDLSPAHVSPTAGPELDRLIRGGRDDDQRSDLV